MDGGRWTVDGGQWTVDGGRWSVDGGRWSGLFAAEFFVGGDHGPEHCSYLATLLEEFLAMFVGKVITTGGRFDPMLGFGLFRVRIGKFAYKMRGVAAFMPCFGNVSSSHEKFCRE